MPFIYKGCVRKRNQEGSGEAGQGGKKSQAKMLFQGKYQSPPDPTEFWNINYTHRVCPPVRKTIRISILLLQSIVIFGVSRKKYNPPMLPSYLLCSAQARWLWCPNQASGEGHRYLLLAARSSEIGGLEYRAARRDPKGILM